MVLMHLFLKRICDQDVKFCLAIRRESCPPEGGRYKIKFAIREGAEYNHFPSASDARAKAAASRRTPNGASPQFCGVRELAPAFFDQTSCRSNIP
jgi:hypothetical protein